MNRSTGALWFWALTSLLMPGSQACAEPAHSPWPGGIAIVDVGSADQPPPNASFNDKPLLLMMRGGRWRAVVGIPLDTTSDVMSIRVGDDDRAIDLVARAYREQHSP